MARKKAHTPEEIVAQPWPAEALVGPGKAVQAVEVMKST